MLRALVPALFVFAGTLAHVQNYPSRPVRLIVAFTAGDTDRTARLIADKMQSTLAETVAVESKPGANGAVAAQYVAQSLTRLAFRNANARHPLPYGERVKIDAP
jgi:tripartite-type tricarboxylate transporter receptor subunit TctC